MPERFSEDEIPMPSNYNPGGAVFQVQRSGDGRVLGYDRNLLTVGDDAANEDAYDQLLGGAEEAEDMGE